MIDVLNEDGTPAGYTASKLEIHEKGLWHRAAHIWVLNNNNEILVQLRAKTVTNHPSEYHISAAGHLSAGDTPIQGALREFEEELGIKLEEKDLVRIGEVQQEEYRTSYINKEWNDVFIVKKDIKIDEFFLDHKEVELVKYLSLNEFKDWTQDCVANKLVTRPKEFKLLFDYLESLNTH